MVLHPVAGLLPGHMHVLLFPTTSSWRVEIGHDLSDTSETRDWGQRRNGPAAEDTSSPTLGMPVLRVWEAENVAVFKRSMAAGCAGLKSPLFFRENSQMLSATPTSGSRMFSPCSRAKWHCWWPDSYREAISMVQSDNF